MDTETSRLPRPLAAVLLIGFMIFALGSVGSPLFGRTVLAATDELGATSPYYDAGYGGVAYQNTWMDDTYTAELPNTMLFAQSLRDGSPAQWNPYVSAGIPLGATPNYALLNPLTLPYYVLPDHLAPGYEKLLEIVVAAAGTYLFLRRCRLGRASALLGGLIFSGTAFMVVWTNWPQTRVAAMIPWVFWGIERLVQHRRVVDGVLLALPISFMLVGGFPSVTAYTLITAAVYFLTRTSLKLIFAGIAAALGGVALAALQLLPFAAFYRGWLIEGRAQTPADHLSLASLATSIAPWTFGGVGLDDKPYWYLPINMVESLSYVGAAAMVLVVAAVTLARAGRALLPRGVWVFLVVATAIWLLLIYLPFPLGWLQDLPVFSSNFIGRARSVLGFLLAALAAVGFELLLRGRRAVTEQAAHRDPAARRRSRAWATSAIIVAAAIGLTAIIAAIAQAQAAGVDQLLYALRHLAIGVALAGLTALLCVLVYRLGPNSSGGPRLIAGTAIAAIVVAQGLSLTIPYLPRVDRSAFYPRTDVQDYLVAHLGHERFTGTSQAMIKGVDAPLRLRALSGHGFIPASLAAMLRGMPGDPVPYPTYILPEPTWAELTSPILDRLAVLYAVTSPRDAVFGNQNIATTDGTTAALAPGSPLVAPVPTTGPIRAAGFTPMGLDVTTLPYEASVRVTVRDASGRVVATGSRRIGTINAGAASGVAFLIPLAGEQVPDGTALSAEFSLDGFPAGRQVTVAANGGSAAISTVTPQQDGLALVHAGSSVIWKRLTALPRVRWASAAVVEPDQERRIALLHDVTVPTSTAILGSPGPSLDGKPATVTLGTDDPDAIEAAVAAQGAGMLVVADALQVGWAATVDGKPVSLVAVDEGVVGVPVPAGEHVVRLHYAAPYSGLGTWISVATALLMVILIAFQVRADRRRKATTPGQPGHHPLAPEAPPTKLARP